MPSASFSQSTEPALARSPARPARDSLAVDSEGGSNSGMECGRRSSPPRAVRPEHATHRSGLPKPMALAYPWSPHWDGGPERDLRGFANAAPCSPPAAPSHFAAQALFARMTSSILPARPCRCVRL